MTLSLFMLNYSHDSFWGSGHPKPVPGRDKGGTDACKQLYADGGVWTPGTGGGTWQPIPATPGVARTPIIPDTGCALKSVSSSSVVRPDRAAIAARVPATLTVTNG